MAPNNNHQVPPVRLFYTILQCLHHVSLMRTQKDGILQKNPSKVSKAFYSKMCHLNDFIKPANPGPEIANRIKHLNTIWLQNVTDCLGNHYSQSISDLKTKINSLSLPLSALQAAETQAIAWGKKNFGNKLRAQTVTKFQNLFPKLAAAKPKPPSQPCRELIK